MAQLLLIKEASLSTRDNRQVGDVVGIFSDGHVFSRHEQDIYTIVQIRDVSREVAQTDASLTQVTVQDAQRAKTTDWTLEEPERQTVWKDPDGNWRPVREAPRLPLRWDADTERFRDNYSRHTENWEDPLIRAAEESRG